MNGGLGRIVRAGGGEAGGPPDLRAIALAERIGGQSGVGFENLLEVGGAVQGFDAISDAFIAQTKNQGVYGSGLRTQLKLTFETAGQTGRSAYLHFQNGLNYGDGVDGALIGG